MSHPESLLEKVENTATEQHQCCSTIRETAYYKWEAAGCPCGDGVEFWLLAEAEVMNGSASGQDLSLQQPS